MVCVKWKIEPTNAHNTKNRLDSRVHFFKYFVNILVRFISKSRLIRCWNQDLFISKSISIHLEIDIDSSRSRDRFISKSRFIYLEIEIDSSRNWDRFISKSRSMRCWNREDFDLCFLRLKLLKSTTLRTVLLSECTLYAYKFLRNCTFLTIFSM